ncbi:MAG: hypothetical protein KA302_00520, partial [Faecalibacterium sp.]|nr:hypothetical protein [Faecalibacterium sp.]
VQEPMRMFVDVNFLRGKKTAADGAEHSGKAGNSWSLQSAHWQQRGCVMPIILISYGRYTKIFLYFLSG